MASRSASSPSDLLLELTSRNGDRLRAPSAIAPISPFHEVLIHDVAAALPPELSEPLGRATTIAEVNDWIAAGAMFRWISDQPYLGRVFLRQLNGTPREAALSLAQTIASRTQPPARDAEWRRADMLGVCLQLLAAGLLVAIRATAVVWLTSAVTWTAPRHGFDAWCAAILDLPLLVADSPDLLFTVLALSSVAVWHVVELVAGAALFERVRCLPARAKRLPLPLPWRLDTFPIVWFVYAGVLGMVLTARCLMIAAQVVRAEQPMILEGSVVVLGLLPVVAAGAAVGFMRARATSMST